MNCKKLCCFLILVSFLSTNALAQNKSNWVLGIEMGVNYSDSSEDTSPLKKERPILPKMGMTVDYNLFTYINLQSGIFYSQKGLRSKGVTEPVFASVKLYQQVIQIPVTALYSVKLSNPKFRMGIGAGMYFSYGIGGKTKANGVAFGQEIDKDLKTFDSILKKTDFGLNCKVFSEYDRFIFNLGYEFGLINIGKSNVLGSNLDYKNRIISATLEYQFNL